MILILEDDRERIERFTAILRVAPIGDDWIESYWRAVVGKLLKV